MSVPSSAIGDWQLERYRLGELPAAQRDLIRTALATGADLAERMARLELSDRDILAQHPPSVVASSIRVRAGSVASDTGRRGASPPRRLALALACGLVLAAGVLLLPGRGADEGTDTTRVKGLAPRLFVYRKATAGVEELAAGSVARENDVVQLAYQAAGRRFGAIVSVDGRGVVTRHLPAAGTTAASLKAGAPFALPDAYRLDDAPGFERFYFVTGDEPFALELVLSAVSRRPGQTAVAGEERLDLPASLDQQSFVLQKETAH
jgi:hypothetical protein